MNFNYKEKIFNFEFDADSSKEAPTIIYIPNIQYPNGYEIDLNDGEIDQKGDEQLIFVKTKKDGVHTINITAIT